MIQVWYRRRASHGVPGNRWLVYHWFTVTAPSGCLESCRFTQFYPFVAPGLASSSLKYCSLCFVLCWGTVDLMRGRTYVYLESWSSQLLIRRHGESGHFQSVWPLNSCVGWRGVGGRLCFDLGFSPLITEYSRVGWTSLDNPPISSFHLLFMAIKKKGKMRILCQFRNSWDCTQHVKKKKQEKTKV